MAGKIVQVILSVILFCTFAASAFAQRAVRVCTWCNRSIPSTVSCLKSGNMFFCSKTCFNRFVESKQPVCNVCGRHFAEGYTSGGKNYCSKSCMETTFPECTNCRRREPSGIVIGGKYFLCDYCAKLPRCSCCQMPLGPFTKTLDDGRKLCRACASEGIFEQSDAAKVMKELRQTLSDKFGLSTNHAIKFDLCSRDDIKKEDGANGERELGLFIFGRRSFTIFGKPVTNKDEYRIMVLNGLPPDFFRSVAAHELAHDWMCENLPHIDRLDIKEGFSEFVSWTLAKNENLQRISWGIEQNTDPVYGDGFRTVRKLLEGRKKAEEWKAALLKAYPPQKKSK